MLKTPDSTTSATHAHTPAPWWPTIATCKEVYGVASPHAIEADGRNMEKTAELLVEHAAELLGKGLRLVPLAPRTKIAIVRGWPQLHLSVDEIARYSRDGVNWGIICHEPLIALDTDTDEAEAWVRNNGIESPVMVRSGGGGLHRYFQLPEGVTQLRTKIALFGIRGLDLKAFGSYLVAAGSIHPNGRRYEYLPGKSLRELHELPVFSTAWLRCQDSPEPLQMPNSPWLPRNPNGGIRDIRAYIRGITSVSGAGGSNACYRVAALLLESGMSPSEALTEMEDWNEMCAFPVWSRTELIHKIESVLKNKQRR